MLVFILSLNIITFLNAPVVSRNLFLKGENDEVVGAYIAGRSLVLVRTSGKCILYPGGIDSIFKRARIPSDTIVIGDKVEASYYRNRRLFVFTGGKLKVFRYYRQDLQLDTVLNIRNSAEWVSKDASHYIVFYSLNQGIIYDPEQEEYRIFNSRQPILDVYVCKGVWYVLTPNFLYIYKNGKLKDSVIIKNGPEPRVVWELNKHYRAAPLKLLTKLSGSVVYGGENSLYVYLPHRRKHRAYKLDYTPFWLLSFGDSILLVGGEKYKKPKYEFEYAVISVYRINRNKELELLKQDTIGRILMGVWKHSEDRVIYHADNSISLSPVYYLDKKGFVILTSYRPLSSLSISKYDKNKWNAALVVSKVPEESYQVLNLTGFDLYVAYKIITDFLNKAEKIYVVKPYESLRLLDNALQFYDIYQLDNPTLQSSLYKYREKVKAYIGMLVGIKYVIILLALVSVALLIIINILKSGTIREWLTRWIAYRLTCEDWINLRNIIHNLDKCAFDTKCVYEGIYELQIKSIYLRLIGLIYMVYGFLVKGNKDKKENVFGGEGELLNEIRAARASVLIREMEKLKVEIDTIVRLKNRSVKFGNKSVKGVMFKLDLRTDEVIDLGCFEIPEIMRLKDILYNFLVNAIEEHEIKNVDKAVEFTCEVVGGKNSPKELFIQIIDYGRGIEGKTSEERIQKIFQEGYSTKQGSRKKRGMGLTPDKLEFIRYITQNNNRRFVIDYTDVNNKTGTTITLRIKPR